MIVDWVVRPVAGRERADTPPAEEIGGEHPPDDARQVLVIDDSSGDALTDVRGQRAHEPFLGIHRQREVLFVLYPPIAVEPLLESARVAPGRLRSVVIAD